MSETTLKVEVIVNKENKDTVWNLLNFAIDNDCFFVFEKDNLTYRPNISKEEKQDDEEKPVLTRTEISKLTKDAMDLAKKEMRAFPGPIYGWDKKDGKLRPNWKEQKHIDYMRWLYYQDKWSASAIAKRLNKDKVKGKRGGKWTSATIMRTINNSFHKNRDKFDRPKTWHKNTFPELSWHKKPRVLV